jgi:uncharacterized protein (DUF342 family)
LGLAPQNEGRSVTAQALKLSVTIDAKGMQAFAALTPAAVRAGGIAADEVQQILREKGIVFGVRPEALEEIINAFGAGEVFNPRVLIAQGLDAQPAVPPQVAAEFDEGQLVGKGQVLAHLEGGIPAQTGRTVRGEAITPPRSRECAPQAGKNVEFSESDHAFRAQVPGYPEMNGRVLEVIPLIDIAEDQMSASATVRWAGQAAEPPSRSVFRQMLEDAGIAYGVVEDCYEKVSDAMASTTASEQAVLVARGRSPITTSDVRRLASRPASCSPSRRPPSRACRAAPSRAKSCRRGRGRIPWWKRERTWWWLRMACRSPLRLTVSCCAKGIGFG